jgi:hypothetical protein
MKKCKVCGTKKNVKSYIIADDMENPQPYCRKCWLNLLDDVLFKIVKDNPELICNNNKKHLLKKPRLGICWRN